MLSNLARPHRAIGALLGVALLSWGGTMARSQPEPAADSDEQRVADLVTACHIAANEGVVDSFGHLSVRSAKNPERFFMSRALAPANVTVADIMELDMGGPEDVAPMVVYLLSDKAQEVTGQVYTANGGTIAVWDQPHEVREMRKDGRWTPEEIEARFDEVGVEPMPLIAQIEERRAAAASGEKPNA